MSAQPPPDAAGRPTTFPWPPMLLAATLAGGLGLQHVVPLAWPGLDDMPARVAGLALGIAGLILFAWAVLTVRRHSTTVSSNRGATVLVTDGPYRRWRNPIYIAQVLLLLGAAELTKSIWIVLLTPAFVLLITWLAILPEERHLEAKFGRQYLDYKAKTRRWI